MGSDFIESKPYSLVLDLFVAMLDYQVGDVTFRHNDWVPLFYGYLLALISTPGADQSFVQEGLRLVKRVFLTQGFSFSFVIKFWESVLLYVP